MKKKKIHILENQLSHFACLYLYEGKYFYLYRAMENSDIDIDSYGESELIYYDGIINTHIDNSIKTIPYTKELYNNIMESFKEKYPELLL